MTQRNDRTAFMSFLIYLGNAEVYDTKVAEELLFFFFLFFLFFFSSFLVFLTSVTHSE